MIALPIHRPHSYEYTDTDVIFDENGFRVTSVVMGVRSINVWGSVSDEPIHAFVVLSHLSTNGVTIVPVENEQDCAFVESLVTNLVRVNNYDLPF